MGIKNIPIHPDYPSKYDRLLCGGIWCILQLDYEFIEEDKKNTTPIRIRKLTPIQMPHIDMDDLKNGRKAFTKDEWIDVPGWEIPKYRPDFFTDDYGFITDYLSEYMREMRKESYGDAFDKYFRLGNNLNQRDTIAVRKMVSGFVCQNILYDDEGADRSKPMRMIASHNIFGVFAHHRAQCEGIAKTVKVLTLLTQYLLEKGMGILIIGR